jgi:serine/threonine protein kinase
MLDIKPDSIVLERYRVLFPVDERRLVKAYLARDERGGDFDTPILIKHFLHDLADEEPQVRSSLLVELSGLEQLRDPGVVPLLGHTVVDERLITAHGHRPGLGLLRLCESLKQSHRQFPPDLAVYVARRLALAMHRCHSHPGGPFVHGRINLGCVHLPRAGDPQIADFCLARFVDEAVEAESDVGFFQTRISYLAPELAPGGKATPHGDTYALGLVLYRLLSGENPLRGRTAGETLRLVLNHPPPPLELPDWPFSGLANAILARALSKNPAERHQSSEALWHDLAAVQSGSDESLAEELSVLVRSNMGDWAQPALLANSTQAAHARTSAAAQPSPSISHFESHTPAFSSGLDTDRPANAQEQVTLRAPRKRVELRALATTAAVALSTILALGAIFLAARGSGGATASPGQAPSARPQQAVSSTDDFRARFRACGESWGSELGVTRIELTFDAAGKLTSVRLEPREASDTRRGACLLDSVWRTDWHVPGATTLVFDPASI